MRFEDINTQPDNLERARQYLRAIENGASFDTLAEFYSPDVLAQWFPHLLSPKGESRDLTAMRMAAEQGKKVMASQSYEIRHAVSDGDHVALEVDWLATLAVPHGSVPAGRTNARALRDVFGLRRRQDHCPAQL